MTATALQIIERCVLFEILVAVESAPVAVLVLGGVDEDAEGSEPFNLRALRYFFFVGHEYVSEGSGGAYGKKNSP